MTSVSNNLDDSQIQQLEQKYDSEVRYRPLSPWLSTVTGVLMFALAVMQYINAGTYIVIEEWAMAITLSIALFLCFMFFGIKGNRKGINMLNIGQVPLYDWVCAILSVVASLYVAVEFHNLTFRIGNPLPLDLFMGSALIVLTLEATRRVMGITLPIVVLVFILYALYGQKLSGILQHPGSDWTGLVSHLYLTTQGIFGVPLQVTVSFVFHFVLFGAVATKMGLGKLFLNLAYSIAGKFSGGPAKVSVLSSAFFGMISGSSIANTVSTGVMTIPAMKRVGYRPDFAAAVEATASTGGQITPPLMGAAAFVMAEMLEVPYLDILIAASIPAFMHFWGVLIMVHLEAKRLGLKGLPVSEIPRFIPTLLKNWVVLTPLVLLIFILVSGKTAYAASFYAITAAVGIGLLSRRMTLQMFIEAFQDGTKYTLSIITAGAAVGIIIGVVTLTGMGFRTSYVVINFANQMGDFLAGLVPFSLVTAAEMALISALILTAMSSIVLGAGIPTTACYIILASIAAPTLGVLGVPLVVSHFFVFYYGVLADITPPVAVAAYAGAGIANSNPFKTGNTAFKLANAKALVPFVFIFAPSILIIVPDFELTEMIVATVTSMISVAMLGTAFVGYLYTTLPFVYRIILFFGALFMISQNTTGIIIGCISTVPIVIHIMRYINKKPSLGDNY